MRHCGLRCTIPSGILALGIFLSLSCGTKTEEDAGKPAPAAQTQTPKVIKTESGFEMALIPGGTFVMGDAKGPPDTQPAHEVTVSAFYMDTREVTQAMYEDLIGNNPAKFDGEQNPMEQIRWTQAVRYCNARSEKEGLKPCYDEDTWACDFTANGYRLPTEAEWEYACRAGTTTKHSFGDDPQTLKSHAWFKANSDKKTHPVGAKTPNPWGLWDMYGNVAEWCNDWYAEDYYRSSPHNDPRGPDTGTKRVLRGGAWTSPPEKCSSVYRMSDAPALPDVCLGYDDYGFRCVRNATTDR